LVSSTGVGVVVGVDLVVDEPEEEEPEEERPLEVDGGPVEVEPDDVVLVVVGAAGS